MPSRFELFVCTLVFFLAGAVSAQPTALGPEARISFMGVDGDANIDAGIAAIAYSPIQDEYLVAWIGDDGLNGLADDETEVWGQRIDAATGDPVGARIRISAQGPDGDPNWGPRGLGLSVVYNSVDDEYAVFWGGTDNTGSLNPGEEEIFMQRLDAATGLEVGGDDVRISNQGVDGLGNADARFPSAAYNPADNQYLVVWSGDEGIAPLVNDEQEVWGQRIDAATGAEVGAQFRISQAGPDGSTSYPARKPDVAFSATRGEYFVVWEASDDAGDLVSGEFEIYGQFVDPDTSTDPVPGTEIRLSETGVDGDARRDAVEAAVAWDATNNRFLATWLGAPDSGQLNVFGQVVDGVTGLPVGNDFRISQSSPNNDTAQGGRRADVAYDPARDEFLAVWETRIAGGGEIEIAARVLDAATMIPTADQVLWSDVGPSGNVNFDALRPTVAYDAAGQFLVAWEADDSDDGLADDEFEIYARRGATNFAELTVTKTDQQDYAVAGETLTYTIVVANAGPLDAVGVTVEDVLPPALTNASWSCAPTGAATCTASGLDDIVDTVDLPAGDSVIYTLTADIDTGFDGDLVNIAEATLPPELTDIPDDNIGIDVTDVGGLFKDGFESGG